MVQQGDFVEFTVQYTMQNIEMANTFYYIYEATPTLITAPVEDCINEFQAEVVGAYMDFLSNDLVAKEIRLNNLTNTQEFGIKAINLPGSSSGDPLPTFVALGLKKSVSTRLTRPGSIRFAGIAEADIAGGVWTNTAKSNGLAAVVAKDWIVDSGVDSGLFKPIIVGRNTDGSFNTSVFNNVTSVGQPRVTTQNSRKR